MVLNLDCKLSGRSDDQPSDSVHILSLILFKSADDNIDDGNTKSEGFALTCLGSYNHVNMRLQVHKGLPLHDGRFPKIVGDERLSQFLAHFELRPIFNSLLLGLWLW